MDVWTLSQIGPFISGVSLFLAAIVAAFGTLWVSHNYQKRELYQRWLDSFRILYEEFWKNRDIAQVKNWIVSDQLYARHLQPVLKERNCQCPRHNNLDWRQNRVLSKVDHFCSLLVRAKYFARHNQGMGSVTPEQHELGAKLFIDFWMDKVKGREELEVYIKKHWKELFEQNGASSIAGRPSSHWAWLVAMSFLLILCVALVYFYVSPSSGLIARSVVASWPGRFAFLSVASVLILIMVASDESEKEGRDPARKVPRKKWVSILLLGTVSFVLQLLVVFIK